MLDKIKKLISRVKVNPKYKIFVIVFGIALVLILAGWFLLSVVIKPAPKQVYDVAVMVRNQGGGGGADDAKTNLKKGDVLAIQKQGHNWSNTEKISYLILQMELTQEQKQKLMQPKTKDLDKEEGLERGLIRQEELEGENAMSEAELEERLRQTVIAREYYIDFDELPKEFKPADLMSSQPFAGEVFDWGIVEEKD
jgi:hypothetical protein